MIYKVCCIGLGVHGFNQLRYLLSHPEKWHVACIIDPSKIAYARFQSQYYELGTPFYDNIDSMLERSLDLDAIVISTTAGPRLHIAQSILSSGYKNKLLLEKPITNVLADAKKFQEKIITSQLQDSIKIDYGRRAANIYRDLKSIILSGEIGLPINAEFNRPCKLNMKSSHQIDLVSWLIDSNPKSVIAKLDDNSTIDHRGSYFYDPGGYIKIVYNNNFELKLNTGKDTASLPQGLFIRCERGSINVNVSEDNFDIVTGHDKRQVKQEPNIGKLDWFGNALEALIIQNKNIELCSIDEAINCLEVMLAAHISSRQNSKEVFFPLAKKYMNESLRIA